MVKKHNQRNIFTISSEKLQWQLLPSDNLHTGLQGQEMTITAAAVVVSGFPKEATGIS